MLTRHKTIWWLTLSVSKNFCTRHRFWLFKVLRTLCRNSDGLFWAGDTAQTISSGCSFRFQDLKAMLYRVEVNLTQMCASRYWHSGQQQQVEEIDPASSSKLPETFSLTVNYRSHSGITNCAHSVVELIQQFWPYSIDILAPEQGFFVGPLPVILAMSHSDNIQFVRFLAYGI